MVRYTRPPSPTWQATTRSAPTKHLSDQHGRWPAIKLQAYENKGVIRVIKAVFAVTDEGDEGARPLIDMTKVTRSTLADKTLPNRATEQFKGDWLKDGARKQRGEIRGGKPRAKNGMRSTQKPLETAASGLVLLSGWQVIIKPNRKK